ncbi:unnamed protein product [Hymenolepis diminuta]|uniref:Uncharacterized protein n=1 Tax=Hymenolepis diminuta TaxID=6216 RepID=A0A564Y2I7_HYMDI|nr:unnamed protein product [Hymenolepis diminuta]
MWPNGSGWPQWPQNIPSTAEETSRWAELARQWATTNNPQLPTHQFPPPPPPPPPVEDQDDRIFIPPPPPPPSTKFEDNSINRPRDSYEQFSLECCPVLPLDQWQGENLCFHQPPEEDYGRYPNVNEHHPQPPLPRHFRPDAPPPSYGIHKPPPMSCPCPPPSMPFNGEENWMYHNQYQQQSDYSPTPVPPMSFPPPPPSPQGPMTPSSSWTSFPHWWGSQCSSMSATSSLCTPPIPPATSIKFPRSRTHHAGF